MRFTVNLERMQVGPFEILVGFELKDKGPLSKIPRLLEKKGGSSDVTQKFQTNFP